MSHLGGGAHLKRLKYDIHHSLRREHVSSDHSCILGRLEDGAGGDDHFDRLQATLRERKEEAVFKIVCLGLEKL